jgi:hypothetical protein
MLATHGASRLGYHFAGTEPHGFFQPSVRTSDQHRDPIAVAQEWQRLLSTRQCASRAASVPDAAHHGRTGASRPAARRVSPLESGHEFDGETFGAGGPRLLRVSGPELEPDLRELGGDDERTADV